MHIQTEIRTADILKYTKCRILSHNTTGGAREETVHFQLRSGDLSRSGFQTQWIQCRIDIHDPCQTGKIFFDPAEQFITDILPLQLVSVNAGHDADPLLPSRQLLRCQAVFLDLHYFFHHQIDGGDCFYHIVPLSFDFSG